MTKIFESPDKGKTVYSRKFGEQDMSKRKLEVSSTVTFDDIGSNETIGTVPVLTTTEDIGWNNSHAFAPVYNERDEAINKINKSLDTINKRLAILEPNLELNEKFEGLKQLYQEYKAMEKLLSGPTNNEEE